MVHYVVPQLHVMVCLAGHIACLNEVETWDACDHYKRFSNKK